MSRPAPALVRDGAVTLVGGAPFAGGDLRAALARAPTLAAADSGADRARALGLEPEIVIGDMDSLSPEGRAALGDRVLPIPEQDSTDFEKCLTRIAAPLVLAVGFAGARLDHALAVFNTLARCPDRRCVVLGDGDAATLCPPRIALDLDPGTRVSLFPMAPVTGRSAGLTWPIDGIAFAPGGAIGTSNRATGPVRLEMDAPGMLLMVPPGARDALLAGLDAAPRWPAP